MSAAWGALRWRANTLGDRNLVALSCGFAGYDERLEREPSRVTTAGFSRVRFSHRKLLHVKAQKVKADLSAVVVKCMRDTGFARFEFKAHVM